MEILALALGVMGGDGSDEVPGLRLCYSLPIPLLGQSGADKYQSAYHIGALFQGKQEELTLDGSIAKLVVIYSSSATACFSGRGYFA